jgi:hypothetical protein
MKTKFFVSNRLLVTAMCCIFSFSLAQAQMSEGKVRFGLKVGVNGANLYDDANAEDRSTRIGFVGGPFVKVPLVKNLALRPELLLSMKGGKYDFTQNIQSNIKLTYIELPLSLEYDLLGFINLHGGVQGGYLIGSNGKLQDSNGNAVNFNFDKEDFEQLDLGWHLGAGIDFGNIGLHLRVARGLRDVSGNDVLNNFVGTLKNAAWALTLSAAL